MTSPPLALHGLDADASAAAADDDRQVALAREDLRQFAPLYERHVMRVYRYLRARTSSEDVAAELTSVTFERALTSLHTYRGQGAGFAGWLLGIARNAAIDHHRRTRPHQPLDAVPEADHPTATGATEELVLAADDARLVRAHLRRLSPVEQEAILLRYAAGLSASRIGPIIGKSEAATQKLIRRALGRLKESLDDR